MTNKQAIETLLRIRCIIREDSLEDQALVYAIEALKAFGNSEQLPSAQQRTETHACDLISRQDAIEALHDEIVRKRIDEDTHDDGALDEFDTEAILRRLPSAQPEIIRCKDCKYLQKKRSEESAKKFGQIYQCAYGIFRAPHADDFCSKAERREE